MYHSITFGTGTLDENGFLTGKNTWDDWHLIPSSRTDIAIPQIQSNLVTIPGKSGVIDLSDYLTGSTVYGDRSGSWEFIVDNDHECWIDIKNNIMNYLHGQKMKCSLENDPAIRYTGRFSVNEWKSQSYFSTITINYVISPYKESGRFTEDWLWDPFNFNTDRTDSIVEGI